MIKLREVYDESILRRLGVKAAVEPYDVAPSGLDAGVLGYEEQEDGFSCKRCVFYKGAGVACAVVDTPVSPDGCCDFWANGSDRSYNGPLLEASSAAYVETDPAGKYTCGSCRFIADGNNCPVVGYVVDPDHGTCTVWEPEE